MSKDGQGAPKLWEAPQDRMQLQSPDVAAWSVAMPYLPPVLVEEVRRHPNRLPPWIDSIEGTLAFADISGFTRMSERLAETGKEGAERLTDILNQYFHRMLDIAYAHGGTNVKFGGDALLLLFRGKHHASRAVATALAMQRASRRSASVRLGRDRIRTSMSIGVDSGLFWCATAGIPGLRMQHFILGREASRVVDTEAAAAAGEVFITEATLSMLDGSPQVEARGDFFRVLRFPQRVGALPLGDEITPPSALVSDLLAFLPPPIGQALTGSGQVRHIEGEHRKVTIAFINLLGINELLLEHGPPALLEQLQRYLSSVIRLTERYGGFLAGNDIDSSGLKLILVFGAPVAHEQDPANALRLALELQGELSELNLRHRIGINGGFVFAGDVGSPYRREYTVIGDAVNLAARLMAAAPPGQILLSRQTAAEAGSNFILQELEPITVKGKKKPVPICALHGEHQVTPAKTLEQRGLLFGREAEVDAFRHLCAEVEGGRGKAVVISGEAGMGKTRLVLEFQDYLRARGWALRQGHCYSHLAGTPFAPWLHVLNSFFDFSAEDTSEGRAEKVVAVVQHLRPDLPELASLLNGLLSLSIPQTDVVQSLDEETRRRRLYDLIAGLLQARASESPLAVFIEDLHWADHSSLQLINHIGANLERSCFLLCLTYRPIEGLSLSLPPVSTITIALGELPEEVAVHMISTMLNQPQLPPQVAKAILAKARGNPLFLEEVARSVRQSRTLELASAPSVRLTDEMALLEIPDRVQALIMSRIDALGGATREVLRTAAVLGNTFTISDLRALFDVAPGHLELESWLQELAQLNLLFKEGDITEPIYRFKHALIQEVAYDSLLFARRRKLHHRFASYVESQHQEQLEPFYEVLVYHYRRSSDHPKTLVYAVKAADKARRVFAHEEAIEYYHRGLTALEEMGGPVAYHRSHIMECIGDCYEIPGHHDQASQAYRRALRGCRNAVHSPALPLAISLANELPNEVRKAVLCRKIGVSCERGSDYDSSLKWLDSAWRVLPPRQPLQASQVSVAKSVALFRKGLYKEALEWGRRGLALSRRSRDSSQMAYAHNMLANSYLELGKLKDAVRHRHTAVRLYEEVGNPSGLLSAHNNLGSAYQLLGMLDKALEHYQTSIEAGKRVGNSMAVAVVHNNVGEVLLMQGRIDEAIDHFLQVVKTYEQSGDPLAATGLALVNLSRAHQRQKDYKKAIERLEQGIELLRKAGARVLLTEAFLQRAELELETGQCPAALRLCGRMVKEARQLGAKLLEARGIRILGRIAIEQGQGEKAEAYLRESVALAGRLGADYEKGLAFLYLAKLYGDYIKKSASRLAHRLASQQAMSIFRRLGVQDYSI